MRSIDHASEFDDPTMRLLVEKGAFLNPQYGWNAVIVNADFLTPAQSEKAMWVVSNSESVVELIRKYRPKVTFNIDAFGPTALWATVYAAEFSERARHYSNIEILRQATSGTAALLAMSGKRNPYPGKLGVIEEDALADVILVDGNPLEDITVLGDPENNIPVFIKDGKVVKNEL